MDGLGYSPDQPITVAGGRIFAGFNEQQYLSRLRGPAGDPVTFERLGSTADDHILDIYRVASRGLDEPVHLLLDAYAPGPNGIPDPFTLDRPDEPWRLATSIVPADATAPPPADIGGARKWQIVASDGAIFGYVEWDGEGSISLDMPPETGNLLRDRMDTFMEMTPPAYQGAVLADVLEVFVPAESRGLVRGLPWSLPPSPEWSGPAWGA